MENVEKAIVMSVQVIMFVLALTIAVVLYYQLNSSIKSVFSNVEYSNRGDSIIGNETSDSTRKIFRSELIASILNLGYSNISVVKVEIGGTEITFELDDSEYEGYGIRSGSITYDRNSSSFCGWLMSVLSDSDAVYHLDEFSGDTLVYSKTL